MYGILHSRLRICVNTNGKMRNTNKSPKIKHKQNRTKNKYLRFNCVHPSFFIVGFVLLYFFCKHIYVTQHCVITRYAWFTLTSFFIKHICLDLVLAITVCNFVLHRMHYSIQIFDANSPRICYSADRLQCGIGVWHKVTKPKQSKCQKTLIFFAYFRKCVRDAFC